MSCLILFVWSSSSCDQREVSKKFRRSNQEQVMKSLSRHQGPLTIKSVISLLIGIKLLVIPFAFDFAFKMHIKEKSFQHSISLINYMLAYQPLWYYGLKMVGVRNLEEYYNRLSANVSHQVVLYYDNIVLLRYNKWKASYNTRQLDNWIKFIHV